MKFILTYEYLKDLVLFGTPTHKQIKKFMKWQIKDQKRLGQYH